MKKLLTVFMVSFFASSVGFTQSTAVMNDGDTQKIQRKLQKAQSKIAKSEKKIQKSQAKIAKQKQKIQSICTEHPNFCKKQ
jgi:septal ring factor EnvC (AmiA/AmiB activator)